MAAHHDDTRFYVTDIVINDYMKLIVERFPSVYAFDTFFYWYNAVKRWTKKLNIFSKSKLLIPININEMGYKYWVLVCVNVLQKQICYYDSINTRDVYGCSNKILTYLSYEHSHKLGNPLPIEEWGVQMPGNPKQNNGFHSGAFICMFAYYLAHDQAFNFTQADMWSFSMLMACELTLKKILTSEEQIKSELADNSHLKLER
ncbi:unnamed protein product [Macrosiphum euphorbiae]|uniref:Ubiquitin-like protease family profile domain-containing protein n=1 Tax=Macrosiphum euphorbiae TaxID=13131 RepID=A0AAV0X613_9HEMI|nr:unnamed protein product [Macrosiphum euphorbiae]